MLVQKVNDVLCGVRYAENEREDEGKYRGFHGVRLATPNDPKLSDSGPGAARGSSRREAKARDVPGFMEGSTARD